MSGKNKREEKRAGQPMIAAPGKNQYAMTRSGWQKFLDALGFRRAYDEGSKYRYLNSPTDSAEGSREIQEKSGPSEAAFLKLLEQVKTMDRSLQDLSGLSNRVNLLETQLEELRSMLTRSAYSSQVSSENHLKRNYDDSIPAALPSSPQPASRPTRMRGNDITIDALDRAICQALAEQTSTGLEIESFLANLRAGTGNVPLVVEYVGQRVGDRWQIAVFVLPSNQGLAVVSPGGLADSEVSTFFEVDYGRRIFACIQPARVERSGTGKEFTVRRKGRVESS